MVNKPLRFTSKIDGSLDRSQKNSDFYEKSVSFTGDVSSFAPVIVFCFRRPDHLRRTLESLKRCYGFELSPVIVFGDGPKKSDEVEVVEQTRNIARMLLKDSAEYHFRDENAGLARSVIEGVGNVLDRFGRAIIIEDDLEFSPEFLIYMNHALERFEHEEKVWQVSGYMFDVPEFSSRTEAIFLPITASWGWGTWKRAWDKFDPSVKDWQEVEKDSSLRYRFNLNGAYDYSTMLKRQMLGKLDSWAVRWYWTVFRANGIVVFPPRSLVTNNGFDGSGTHGRGFFRKRSNRNKLLVSEMINIPQIACVDNQALLHLTNYLSWQNGNFLARFIDFVRKRLF